MASVSGFWSYVHADDEADHGRIADLARDVVEQFNMLTGDAIDLFLDRDALEWGDKWKAKIDSSLASIAFFIPVLTPRYFRSPECRRELQFFARQATALGVTELVLPLLYVNFPALHEEEPSDDLVALVRPFHWEDWTELRFAERASGDYRRAVMDLARRLVAANEAAESVDVAAAAETLIDEGPSTVADGDDLGVLDRLAAAEEAMPKWSETLDRISAEIARIGEAMERATTAMQQSDQRGKGFAGRLRVARNVADGITAPSNEVLELGNDFATQLHSIDLGIRAIIDQAPAEVAQDSSAKDEVCEFFAAVRELARSSEEGLGMLKGMIDAIAPIERMSRDLRPPLRALRRGLTLLLEGREVTSEWINLIETSPIECDAAS